MTAGRRWDVTWKASGRRAAFVASPADCLDVLIVEAGESRERWCADCGRHTPAWKADPSPGPDRGPPHGLRGEGRDAFRRRTYMSIVRRLPQSPGPFCGRCGLPIECACPTCDAGVEVDDVFAASAARVSRESTQHGFVARVEKLKQRHFNLGTCRSMW